ncbi:hypothetical protein MHI01_02425 [Paenibacillus sp. FSL M7-0656]|uniref:hypothetical protein n=1 Tax=Paenibacillus TaxID=44249 RepID=UPI0020A0F1BE|nr:hypothetical protein [Paenibacillus xylanexedens]MCP1427139.1 hypothetical protein [Paenibacillus xylanexedens]
MSREVIIRYDREDWNRMHRTNRCTEETYDTRVIGRLLIQVSAHYGYHAGQIVVLAKIRKNMSRVSTIEEGIDGHDQT